MNIVVFDTETVNLEKPYCYNIGYLIYDTEQKAIVERKEFIVEQVWHNLPLFETAYYKDKRKIYVSRMRGKQIKMQKWGYIMREMRKDFDFYEISQAYAYNSQFDEKVFDFNCEWFKTLNPFDNVSIYDIRGYVHQVIAFDCGFQLFCDTYELYTDTGNYSTTAETVFRYLTNNNDFVEEHTALADSEIELEILVHCVEKGCEWETNYKVYRTIASNKNKTIEIVLDGETIAEFEYKTKRNHKNKIFFAT